MNATKLEQLRPPEIKVERDVPVPEWKPRKASSRKLYEALIAMEVGESFLYPKRCTSFLRYTIGLVRAREPEKSKRPKFRWGESAGDPSSYRIWKVSDPNKPK